ncbi:MAG TPA: FAD-binding protein, partial [Candidatus Binatia bacterium]
MTANSKAPLDVLVIGGGNAALCAAITARRAGASVLILETATKDFRGGNSRHTRDIRYMHRAPTGFVTHAYGEEEFWQDLLGVTGGATNEALARLTIRESETLADWLAGNGVRWQKPLRGTLHLARSNLFMLGGGKAMMNAYYDAAAKLGVQVHYETEVRELEISDGEFLSALAVGARATSVVAAKTIVIAAGGFEANIPWLKEYWGEAAENFIVRGTPNNQGRMLKQLLRHGAKP